MNKFLLLTVQMLLALTLCAQPGQLDPSFNTSDVGAALGASFNSFSTCSYVQPDGKILLGGQFAVYSGSSYPGIIRINQDGTIDPSFNIGSGINAGGITDIGYMSNGKIVLVGSFTSFNGVNSKNIILLNADGSVDTGFNIGTGPSISISRCEVQSDNKIIVSGNFTSVNGTSLNNLARLNTNGSIDLTYLIGTGSANSIGCLQLQSDGKLLIAGSFSSFNGTAKNRLARLNSDGTVDNSFDVGTGPNTSPTNLVVQNDGKIIITGLFNTFNGVSRIKIARINTDGSLDTSFDPGTGFDNSIFALNLDNSGKILVGGAFGTYNGIAQNRFVRLNSDGSVDNTFDIGLGPSNPTSQNVQGITVLSDNSVLVSGGFDHFDGIRKQYICKVTETGSLDNTFGSMLGVDYPVTTSVSFSNGNILIAGDFTMYNGVVCKRIALLDSEGELITNTNFGSGFNGIVNKLIQLPSGEILALGSFTQYNGVSCANIICINQTGDVSSSFTTSGTDGEVKTGLVQPDGKIVLVGGFSQYNGTSVKNIVRITSAGNLDPSLNSGSGTNSPILAIARQSDGKFVIGGDFASYNGTSVTKMARLNSDGSIDATMNFGSGPNLPVTIIHILTNGKVLVSGIFSTFNATSTSGVALLNSDGSVDASFGSGVNGWVLGMEKQVDDKILVFGAFSSFNGSASPNIFRLNANATLDATFNAGAGGNLGVYYAGYLQDKRILVSGVFTSYNGTKKNQLVRIYSETLPPPNLSFENKTVSFGSGPVTWIAFRNNTNTTVEYAVVSGTCATISTSGVVTITCAGTVTVSAVVPYDGTYRSDTSFATLTILKGQSFLNLISNGAEVGGEPFKLFLDSIYDGIVEYKLFGDTNIATISSDGYITPKAPGTVKVQAIARENGNYLPSISSVDVTIYPVKIKPLAVSDTINIVLAQDTASKFICLNDTGRTARLDYLTVDLDVETDGIQRKRTIPSLGYFYLDFSGTLFYEPFEGFLGKDSLAYTINDEDGLTSNVAYIIVNSEKNAALTPELKANTIMTPNGDGQNDVLLIGYADMSKKNEIWIYDENGNEVYHTEDYQNDWSGVDKKSKTLTNGIYFFIFKEFEGEEVSKVYKNYCQVIR